jgi:hypothetical protein
MKNILITGSVLIALAGIAFVVIPLVTAPKAQSEEEIQAAVTSDMPEIIPEAQLAMMTKVRFKMPGYE